MINKKALYLLSLFSIVFAGTITQATPQSMLKRAMRDRRTIAAAGVVLGVAGTLLVVYRGGVYNGLVSLYNKLPLVGRKKHNDSEPTEDIS